jgi:hypothetical protein
MRIVEPSGLTVVESNPIDTSTIEFRLNPSEPPQLSLRANGEIFVNGRLAENDKAVVDGLREIIAAFSAQRKSPRVFRHNKSGNLYEYLLEGINEPDLVKTIAYKSMHQSDDPIEAAKYPIGTIWFRSTELFNERFTDVDASNGGENE